METSLFQQIVIELLGKDLTGVVLLVAYIFAFAGMFLRWYWMYQTKGKVNPETPVKFNLVYWLRDNLLPKLFGMLATFVIIFVSIRFPQELLGSAFSYVYAFTIGMSLDYVASVLKKLSKSV